jgi:streptomycin 6-kinase
LQPGASLSKISNEEAATEILVRVIERMSAHEIPNACPTVEDWGKGFERYLTSADKQVPKQLVESAQQLFADLCASQSRTRLLHGDLHHYNVLSDSNRDWLAIDPKGVVGELEYEIGAVLRNPFERPELFLSRTIIERRLRQFATELRLDYQRMLRWAFAQAVLSAIWEIEDGFTVDLTNPSLRLAEVVGTMIPG